MFFPFKFVVKQAVPVAEPKPIETEKIKFRIWSKLLNKYITDLFLHNLCDADKNCLNDIFSNNNLIFQRWTGFLDKNGKEIYEGDVINAYVDFAEGEKELDEEIHECENCVVEWKRAGFWVDDAPLEFFDNFEITGNILEH